MAGASGDSGSGGFPGDAGVWRRAASGELLTLITEAARVDAGSVAGVAGLRRFGDAAEAAVALQIAEARRRLAAKGFAAESWIADVEGAQMASDARIARHKAERFRGLEGVADLCCGIGADAAALAAVCGVAEAVDLDERRCAMTAHNTGVATRCADVSEIDSAGWTVHIDPARRDGSGRLLRLGDLAPGAGVIARLASRSAGAAIKLMPGVDEADLAGVGIEGELEYISRGGRLSQAVVWTGSLRRHRRSATVIDGSGRAHTIAGEPHEPGDAHGLGPWLVQPDPVAERAGLLPELADRSGLDVLHPRLGLLTGEALEPSAWLAGFRVIERMPWRVERVRASLASLDAGIVEVKTRGGACDPDEVQRQLRGDGERMLTVFVLRFGEKIEAIVTERG